MQSTTASRHTISIFERLKQKVLVFDGAMGTAIQTYHPTSEDFEHHEGCNDFLCKTRPEMITEIHASYILAGAECIETNTFGSNRIKLEEYGIADQLISLNQAAVHCAQQAILQVNPDFPVYIIGSMGPSGYLPSSSDPVLSDITVDYLYSVYKEQAAVLIAAGVDGLLIETGQDLLEMKHAIIGAKDAIAESGQTILLMAQPTLDTTGRMLLGTDAQAFLPLFIDLGVDVLGLNCSTGPDEMRSPIRYLGEYSPVPISVIPNAGLPENREGDAHYHLEPEPFAKTLSQFVSDFGVSIVGGCCGTTPAHIRALVKAISNLPFRQRTPAPVRMASSSMGAVSFDIENKPLIVGERLNSQGSRKFKHLLLEDDYDTMSLMARQQVEGGAHLLDLCVALNEREDEGAQMSRLVRDLSQQVEAPLVIDSTEYGVIEQALKLLPGRGIVNSIHLEGNGDRVHKILPLLKRYGGSAVAMLIDQSGMAKTIARKIEVAQKLYDIVTLEYRLPAHTLIFDPLVFTLATGDQEFRESAKETIAAIQWIKANLENTYTILGISNVSFGLTPAARRVLNSVYLYHTTVAGLDFAIVNPTEVIPYPALSDQERKLANALVFNETESALAEFIDYFQTQDGSRAQDRQAEEEHVVRTVEEQIRWQILNRKKEGIEAHLDTALQTYAPAAVINQILLPSMKEVGDKMATGELILPFVLQSAEVMKKSVSYLEQFLDKADQVSKGTLVLATVYGDVHDIGKNLVKTIFSNNGYVVHDLGKQVPLTQILAKAKEVKADAIGLSALLVTTSKQMAYCVEECHQSELNYPIIIGGAAINRDYGFRISCLGEEITYPAGVFYAKDAFEGLNVMNRLMNPEEQPLLMQEYQAEVIERKQRKLNYEKLAPTAIVTTERQVRPSESIPEPPFWGVRKIDTPQIDQRDVAALMDYQSLFRLSWGLKNKSPEEFEFVLKTEFEPLLETMLIACQAKGIFKPQVLYGYFPCYAEANDLIVLDPLTFVERERFSLPRQTSRDLLCMSDYFNPKPSDGSHTYDVLPLQLVTMGREITQECNRLDQASEYAKSYYLHGLGVQMAEGLAQWAHHYILKELNLPLERGKRYSFGYPACPDLSDQAKQFALLDAQAQLGVSLTEAFLIEPEQSTSALIIHHPEAKYYSV
jgi:5-methyltetrahydrofolate--homocysteine methyltransferase